MTADQPGRRPAPPGRRSRRPGGRAYVLPARLRVRWLLAVIAVMVVLTAGWPLLNSAVSNRHMLRPGARLTIGPGHGNSGQITVGPGWSLLSSQTNPLYGYSLRHGIVGLTVDYVALIGSPRTQHLWEGLRQQLRLTHPGLRLGPPAVITAAFGRRGVTGALAGPHLIGLATIFTDSSRRFAVEMIMIAPRRARPGALAAGLFIMRSMRLSQGSP